MAAVILSENDKVTKNKNTNDDVTNDGLSEE